MKWVFALSALCFIPSGQPFFSGVQNTMWNFLGYETCDNNNINPNFYSLRRDLKEKLFGQEILIEKLVPLLESHFKLEPKKALVICMHGWTGSGKNYATKIIIDSIFKKKTDSEFVRMFNGRLHFPIDRKDYVDEYKINLQNWVRGNVTKCPRSIFVFDEIDKMPAGIIDAVKPFFDYYDNLDSVDYRKSIFIFISNIGAQVINSRFLELWKQGKSREDMKYKDFEPYLRQALYGTEGAFIKSSVIEGHLVSLYLPFLPLEKKQVKKCIEVEFIRQNIQPVTKEDIAEVMREMEFQSDRFSRVGCKRVADIVNSFKYKKLHEEL